MRGRDVRRLIAPDCPRSEGELEKEQNDPQSRQSSKNGNRIRVFPNPNTKRNYSEERLGQRGVKDSDFIFQHRDAQAAENSLQNHTSNGDQTKCLNRLSIFGSPNPNREDDGEKSDRRRNQAMGVLE